MVSVIALLFSATRVLAGLPNHETVVTQACYEVVASFEFTACPGVQSFYPLSQCMCGNTVFIESIFACLLTRIPDASLKGAYSAFEFFAENCTYTESQLEELFNAARTVTIVAPNITQPVSEPFQVTDADLLLNLNGLGDFYNEEVISFYFGAGLIAYWAVALLIQATINTFKKFGMGILKKSDTRVIRRIRRHLILSPSFNHRHSTTVHFGRWWSFHVPLRLHSLIVLIFGIMNTIFLFVDHTMHFPNFESKSYLWAEDIAMRSSFMACYMMPLVFLFGGRNNFFLWLTGWSLEVFNVFHRWIARIMVIDLFIHGVAYSIAYGQIDYYTEVWPEAWWVWGVIGFICGCIMLFQSLHHIRTWSYEVFLVIHIVLAVFFAIGAWIHIAYMEVAQQFVFATIAIWAVDRIVRWVRLALAGGIVPGSAVFHEYGQIIELRIRNPKSWKLYPGCYAFIHVLSGFYFYQSHPFTLVEDPTTPGQFKIFAKVKTGITGRLAKQLLREPGLSKSTNFAIEGSYGQQVPMHHYDTILLIAGGIGVTATYQYAVDLARRDSRQRIIFVWVVSSDAPFEWFGDELTFLAKYSRVELLIYVSHGSSLEISDPCSPEPTPLHSTEVSQLASKEVTPATSMVEKLDIGRENSSETPVATVASPRIPRAYERPNIRQIVTEEVLNSSGTLAVLVCGPGALNDEARAAVADNLCEAKCRTDYYEEAFSW